MADVEDNAEEDGDVVEHLEAGAGGAGAVVMADPADPLPIVMRAPTPDYTPLRADETYSSSTTSIGTRRTDSSDQDSDASEDARLDMPPIPPILPGEGPRRPPGVTPYQMRIGAAGCARLVHGDTSRWPRSRVIGPDPEGRIWFARLKPRTWNEWEWWCALMACYYVGDDRVRVLLLSGFPR